MNSEPNFKQIALIGAGLIGSSLAHAARRAKLVDHIAAYIPCAETRTKAEKAGFADSLHAEIAPCVKGADLVVLAVPIGANAALAAQLAPYMEKDAILTDVGSVKMPV